MQARNKKETNVYECQMHPTLREVCLRASLRQGSSPVCFAFAGRWRRTSTQIRDENREDRRAQLDQDGRWGQ